MKKLLSYLVFTLIICYVQAGGTEITQKEVKYVKVTPESDFKFPLEFHCYPGDPRSCLMHDLKGDVAGVQISFLKDEFSNVKTSEYDFSKNPNFVETNFFGIPAYSFRAYFTDPETLTNEGMQEVEDTATDALYVYLEKKLYKVPMVPPTGDATSIDSFYKQNCVSKKGQYFFYNVYQNADCKKMFPMFIAYDNTKLVSFGIMVFGKGGKKDKPWYQLHTSLDGMIKAGQRPQCMDKLASSYGLTSFTINFYDNPQQTCKN